MAAHGSAAVHVPVPERGVAAYVATPSGRTIVHVPAVNAHAATLGGNAGTRGRAEWPAAGDGWSPNETCTRRVNPGELTQYISFKYKSSVKPRIKTLIIILPSAPSLVALY